MMMEVVKKSSTAPEEAEEWEGEALTEGQGSNPASALVCGCPVSLMQRFQTSLDRNQRREWTRIFAHIKRFQMALDEFSADDGYTAEATAIDGETPDPDQAFKRKVKAAVRRIDPRLLKMNLEVGLREGNMLAAKTLSDIIALPVEAKAKAIDDRPPGINFIDEDMDDDDLDGEG